MRSVPSTHSKNEKIQLLRAAAIICVVMIHTTPAGRDQLLSRPFTNICVAVFFFLSGWLTPLDIPHPASFCRKRILRVLVPYLVWVTLCTIQLGESDRLWYYLLTAKAGPQFYSLKLRRSKSRRNPVIWHQIHHRSYLRGQRSPKTLEMQVNFLLWKL